MRMWCVPAAMMCRRHLLGEHVEIHMFVGTINKGISVQGYLDAGMLDTTKLQSRHDELVAEMEKRGYKHKSELLYVDQLFDGEVDSVSSLIELSERCSECKTMQQKLVMEQKLINIRR